MGEKGRGTCLAQCREGPAASISLSLSLSRRSTYPFPMGHLAACSALPSQCGICAALGQWAASEEGEALRSSCRPRNDFVPMRGNIYHG